MSPQIISRLRPCRWPLWQLRALWLLAWWLGNLLIGLLACWLVGFLAVWFLLSWFSLLDCVLACWFLDVSFHATFFVFAAASLQPLTIAHCFTALGYERLDGLLVCWVCVVFSVLLNSSAEMCAGLLGSGCWILIIFLQIDHRLLVPKRVIWHACCLHFGVLGEPETILGHW